MNDRVWLGKAALKNLLDESSGVAGRISEIISRKLAETVADDQEIEFDFSIEIYKMIFQDIARRSPELSHVEIIAARTCSKMRPDGFG